MAQLRKDPPTEFAGKAVASVTDYTEPEKTGLPKANVLIYGLEDGATVIVRPSGTEPKIKAYYTTLGASLDEAQAEKDALLAAIALGKAKNTFARTTASVTALSDAISDGQAELEGVLIKDKFRGWIVEDHLQKLL